MSRHRDFDAARAENEAEPITFRLAGRDFTIERLPAGPVLDMAANADKAGAEAFAAFDHFLKRLVIAEQRDALREAIDETDIPTLIQVVQWVLEEGTARPLWKSSDSSGGESPNGAASKLAAASAGWTPSD